MTTCIFCDEELTAETKPEHILLSALGGRKKSRCIICSKHNNDFGNTIDKSLAENVKIIRSLLRLESGAGFPPPSLRNLPSGSGEINVLADGTIQFAGKPFTVTKQTDSTVAIELKARSAEHLEEMIPHLAAQVGCSEERLRAQLAASELRVITQRPDVTPLSFSLGGAESLRSIAKSCLELWALAAGNQDVKCLAFDDVRHFILNGDQTFLETRIAMDSRYLPDHDKLKSQYGPLFNLVYVQSDEAGRLIGHFTLYNLISWRIALTESGATPSVKTALISNPLEPRTWSATIANNHEISMAWLDEQDDEGKLERARARIIAMMEHYQSSGSEREISRMVNEIFKEYGPPEGAIFDEETLQRISFELGDRVSRWMLSLPHEKLLSPEAKAKLLRGNG